MSIIWELRSLANSQQAKNLQRFFKTGKGEYGEGDVFLGLKVPQVRQIVRKYWKETNLEETEKLLHSKYHEVRLCGLLRHQLLAMTTNAKKFIISTSLTQNISITGIWWI